MKQLLYNIYTIFIKIVSKLPNPSVSITKTMFALVKLDVSKDNKVSFNGGCVDKSSLKIRGKNNSFICSSNLHKNNIRIIGDNNTVEIRSSNINSIEMFVRGVGCHVIISAGVRMGSGCIICMGKDNSIEIGEDTMIADNVEIWNTDSHGIIDCDGNLLNPSAPVKIGKHVWLGKYAKVLKGVTIGDGSIVGMNSMVTKNIRPNTLNVGIPSKEIKEGVQWSSRFISRIETGEEPFIYE